MSATPPTEASDGTLDSCTVMVPVERVPCPRGTAELLSESGPVGEPHASNSEPPAASDTARHARRQNSRRSMVSSEAESRWVVLGPDVRSAVQPACPAVPGQFAPKHGSRVLGAGHLPQSTDTGCRGVCAAIRYDA